MQAADRIQRKHVNFPGKQLQINTFGNHRTTIRLELLYNFSQNPFCGIGVLILMFSFRWCHETAAAYSKPTIGLMAIRT